MTIETGQESGSQTDEAKTGQEQKVETPATELSTTEQIVKAANEMEESAASKETETEVKPDQEEKAAPYDQDPKWLKARAAEKSLTETLEAHGLESIEDLAEMIKKGESLKDILGTRDADQLTQDLQYAETHRKNLAFWEEKERREADEGLDPDERADKYKKAYEDLQSDQASRKAKTDQLEENKTLVKDFNDRVGKVVDNQGFDDNTAEIAKMLLGVENPFNTVDISDSKAVKAMADNGVKKLGDFVKAIQQDAIDKYAAGKSEFTPISPTETPEGTKVVKETKAPENESVEEGFARANKVLLELAKGGVSP